MLHKNIINLACCTIIIMPASRNDKFSAGQTKCRFPILTFPVWSMLAFGLIPFWSLLDLCWLMLLWDVKCGWSVSALHFTTNRAVKLHFFQRKTIFFSIVSHFRQCWTKVHNLNLIPFWSLLLDFYCIMLKEIVHACMAGLSLPSPVSSEKHIIFLIVSHSGSVGLWFIPLT